MVETIFAYALALWLVAFVCFLYSMGEIWQRQE